MRPLEYATLLDIGLEVIGSGCDVLLCAPFQAQLSDPEWIAKLEFEASRQQAIVKLVWVQTDRDTMRSRMKLRQSPRDQTKLRGWESYYASLDDGFVDQVRLPKLILENSTQADKPFDEQFVELLDFAKANPTAG